MENIGALGAVFIIVLGLGALMFYFWPTLRARDVRHPAFVSIFIINALLGWLLIPWAITLAWAYRHKKSEPGATKRCPHCAEEVKAEATKCKHCQSVL
jgi:antibiotic biosynthesis monooxygenase (ABM) superfamily enzyme